MVIVLWRYCILIAIFDVGNVAQTFLSAGSGESEADVRLPVASFKRFENGGIPIPSGPVRWAAGPTDRGGDAPVPRKPRG
jgi:hypothetical protein